MMLFERLSTETNIADFVVSQLLASNLPIVFFGAGVAARGWIEFLKGHGAPPCAVCVSDAYWRPGQRMGKGLEVEKLSAVLRRFQRFNVVLCCMTRFTELTRELYGTGHVERVLSFGPTRREAMFFLDDLAQHRPELEAFYAQLGDERSRDVLAAMINARITGDKRILDDTEVSGEEQYFPPFLKTSGNSVFVDCGAFVGDTFEAFVRHSRGEFRRYVAFECDPASFALLRERHTDARLRCKPKGVSDAAGRFRMEAGGMSSSRLSADGTTEVELTTLDSEFDCQDATLIKMDIEGAECAALRGAEALIRRNRPTLAICIYHKASDIHEIPTLIHSFHAGYRFYLRRYASSVTDEIVLYAVP